MKEIITLFVSQIKPDANISTLHNVLDMHESYFGQLTAFDNWCKTHNLNNDEKEYLFDLFLLKHLHKQRNVEAYFNTPEWISIEDRTLERGTELMNILMYIDEAIETEVEISIHDFLDEYLLFDDMGSQDEYEIYEDLIDNADLADTDLNSIVSVFDKDYDGNLGPLLRPLFIFFMQPTQLVDCKALLSNVEWAIYNCLMQYYSKGNTSAQH
jgi:hypothetical protein